MTSGKDPGLRAALNELGDILNRPTSTKEQAAYQKPYRSAEKGRPPNLRNISPNQFALPGMEQHAHPGASFLAQGGKFHSSTDYTSSKASRGPRQEYSHSLLAFGAKGETAGELHWAGRGDQRSSTESGHFPGEVRWAARGHPGQSQETREASTKAHPGLMQSMFHMAHSVDMGQSTVPVHSPDRTEEGERWATKTGPAHLTPPQWDLAWRPPEGIHPYEQQARQSNAERMQKKNPGQQILPGMA